MSTNRSLARSAGIIGAGIFSSRILGFIRDIVIANFFGTGAIAQSFVVAFRIPNLLRDFVGEGATNSAFVPVLSEYRLKSSKEEFWGLASVVLNILIVVLAAVTLLGIALSPLIVRLMAPGFIADPQKLKICIFLNRLLFPYIFFVGLAAFTTGLLNTLKHFSAPAFASCFLNLSLIIFVNIWHESTLGLVVGALAGGLLQLVIQLPPLLKRGFRPDFFKRWQHPGAAQIGRLMLPRLASSSIYQLNAFVNTIFASFALVVGEGAVAALYFANRLFQFPLAIFAIALSQAILPSMSEDAAAGNREELKRKLSFGMRSAFLLVVPSSLGLIALAHPIVSVLFERGQFSAYSTRITSEALAFYCIALFAYAASNILISCFFSLKDTRTPAKIAFLTFIINAVLSAILMWPLRIKGLALSMSLAGIVNFLVLFHTLQQKIGPLGAAKIFRCFLKVLLASFVMALAAKLVYAGLALSVHTAHARAGALLVTLVSAIPTFTLAALLFRVSEMGELLKWLFRRR